RRAGDAGSCCAVQSDCLQRVYHPNRSAHGCRGNAGCGLHLRVRSPTMAKSQTSKRDEKHELTRRALIKWSIATGAALGVSRSKIYEILESTAGKSVAFAASAQLINRTFDIEFGNGSLSWMTLFWPLPKIAAAATPTNNFSWHKPGMQTVVQGTDRPLTIGPDTPWAKLP